MKEIFILGAGASHASAGTPLGRDLVWRYYQDCSGLYDSKEDEKKHFKTLLSFLETEPEFKKYCESVEEMMNTQYIWELNVAKRYYVDELMKDLLKKNNDDAIKLIKRLTVEHITESGNGKGNQLYKDFGQFLSEKSTSEVCVISLNFDCWLCEDIKKDIRFDYLLDFDDIDKSREFYKENQGTSISLIKLNGSIDWESNSTTGKIKLSHKQIRPNDYYSGVEVEPFIFLPHQQKGVLMKPLWDRAKRELKQAFKLTIIGYSFPDYDEDIKRLLQESIDSRVELEVVDLAQYLNKQGEIKIKYKKLFPNIANVKFCFDGFQKYLERTRRGRC